MKRLILSVTVVLLAGLALTAQAADHTSKYMKLQGDVDAAIKAFKRDDPGLACIVHRVS